MDMNVRRASPADVEDMAVSLTEGFVGDPEYLWIYGGESGYRRLAPIYFRWRMKRAVVDGDVYLIRGKAVAAGQSSLKVSTDPEQLSVIRDEMRESHGEHVAERLLARARAYALNHPLRVLHWHWTVAAARPDRDTRGVGTALVRHVLWEHGHMPMYGETVTPYQAAWWNKWGFKPVADEFDLTEEIKVTPVWREPTTSRCL